MHKVGADLFKGVDDLVKRVDGKPVCIQLPIGAETAFKGIIDLIRMKAVVWDDESLGAKYNDEEIPAALKEQAVEYRMKMIAAAVELDAAAMSRSLARPEPA